MPSDSPLHPRVALIRDLTELGIQSLLIARSDWLLVCDEPFRALFTQIGLPPARLLALPLKETTIPAGATCIVCVRGPEEPILPRIERRGGRAFGLFRDILPKRIAHAPPGFDAATAAPPAVSYAIATIPRTGSTVLTEELKRLGHGAPAEHVRPPLIAYARRRALTGFDLQAWWRDLTRAQAVDGVFGTKLIWDFLRSFQAHLTPEERDWFLERIRACALYYLVREDKVEQAVSEHVAFSIGVWHKWENTHQGYDQKLAQLGAVDLAALVKTYDSMLAREEALQSWLDRSGLAYRRLSFDDICADPRGQARAIARQLGRPVRGDDAGAPPLLERTTSERHAELAALLRRHLTRPGDRRT